MIFIYGDNMPIKPEFRHEIQPQNLYIAENIPPLAESKLRLPGGKKESRWYSLGSQSTCPFVQFIGGGAVQKIFTWGEMVEVPPGQEVLVKNASYMRGDIFIVSGQDFAAKPRRITVPVGIVDQNGDYGPFFDFSVAFTLTPEFPCDTRNCHEAYFDLYILGGDQEGANINVEVYYWQVIHSWFGPTVPLGIASQWAKLEVVPPLTAIDRFPLGTAHHVGNWTSEPASLLDKVDIIIDNDVVADAIGSIFPTGFYTLNY